MRGRTINLCTFSVFSIFQFNDFKFPDLRRRISNCTVLLLAINKFIDEDRRPGRFLLTDSANLMTLPSVADSLTVGWEP